MSKVLLLGKGGQLGFELDKLLADVGELISFDRSSLDISDFQSVKDKIHELRPDIIVNAAAYTAVDRAEDDEIACFATNASAVGNIAREAKKIGALFVHYSTDYVFDGLKNEPYLESDKPNPINFYGYSKLMGEEAIKYSGCDYLIFRVAWVYHPHYGSNFYRTIERLAKEREELRVVNDQIGVPNDARWLAKKSVEILKKPLEVLRQKSGLYHLSNEGVTSWYEFAKTIAASIPEVDRKCKLITPISTAEYPMAAKRSLYSVLCAAKLRDAFTK